MEVPLANQAAAQMMAAHDPGGTPRPSGMLDDGDTHSGAGEAPKSCAHPFIVRPGRALERLSIGAGRMPSEQGKGEEKAGRGEPAARGAP